MFFDLLSEIASGPHWLVRIWGLIFSASYRREVAEEYRKMNSLLVVGDILISGTFFVAEVGLIIFLVGKSLGYWPVV